MHASSAEILLSVRREKLDILGSRTSYQKNRH